MTTPQRIQLSRAKGFRMQEVSVALNGLPVVNVARPGRWGNPYPASLGLDLCLELFADAARGMFDPGPLDHLSAEEFATVYRAMDSWRRRLCGHPTERAWSELRGRNLACWCALDHRCHADILLEIANQ